MRPCRERPLLCLYFLRWVCLLVSRFTVPQSTVPPGSLTTLTILLSRGLAASFANVVCPIGNKGTQRGRGVNVDFLLSMPSFSMHQPAFQPKILHHHTACHITLLSFLTQRGAHANHHTKEGHPAFTALHLVCTKGQTRESQCIPPLEAQSQPYILNRPMACFSTSEKGVVRPNFLKHRPTPIPAKPTSMMTSFISIVSQFHAKDFCCRKVTLKGPLFHAIL